MEGVPSHVFLDAKEKDEMVFLNTNHTSDILIYAHNPSLRQKAYEYDNLICKTKEIEEILLQINNLRQDKAQILGYNNYIDYSLNFKMAKKISILNEIMDPIYEEAFSI